MWKMRMNTVRFSLIYLFCTGSDYLERARMVEEIGESFWEGNRYRGFGRSEPVGRAKPQSPC
ncbi:hypothetical protein ES703_13635 [subsurface metagenome]